MSARHSSNHQIQPFARSLSSLSGAANRSDGGAPSHFRPTTFDNAQRQTWMHTERGLLVGKCASALGVAKMGCFTCGCFDNAVGGYDLLTTGRGLRGSGLFSGADRERWSAPIASIKCRRQSALKCLTQRLPSHSRTPAVYVPKRRCGVIGSVPVQTGKLPFQRGGRPHVGHG